MDSPKAPRFLSLDRNYPSQGKSQEGPRPFVDCISED